MDLFQWKIENFYNVECIFIKTAKFWDGYHGNAFLGI
jgi:hypothetical protein